MSSKRNKLYNKIINDNKDVIIFGLSYCEWCKKALEYLKNKKISFKYYCIDDYYDLFFKLLFDVTKLYPNLNIDLNHRTVPVIFFKKKFIGGYTELTTLKLK